MPIGGQALYANRRPPGNLCQSIYTRTGTCSGTPRLQKIRDETRSAPRSCASLGRRSEGGWGRERRSEGEEGTRSPGRSASWQQKATKIARRPRRERLAAAADPPSGRTKLPIARRSPATPSPSSRPGVYSQCSELLKPFTTHALPPSSHSLPGVYSQCSELLEPFATHALLTSQRCRANDL